MWTIDNEDDPIIRFLLIHPQDSYEINTVGKNQKTDDQIYEELICGICGQIGSKKPVNVELLKVMGLSPVNNKNSAISLEKKKYIKLLIDIIRKVVSKFRTH